MEELDLQVPPQNMYDTLLNTAAKIGTTVASNPFGQMLLEYTERCLWTVEKSVQWCLLPEQKPECKDEDAVSSNEVEEPAAKLEDTVEPEALPLPWVLFLPLLVCVKAAKTSIDVCSYVLRRESVEPSSIVEFIQTRRNLLKEIKEQIKSNQEEEIKNKSSDDSTTHTSSSNEESEVPKIKVTHPTPEKKEIAREAKTVTETAPVLIPETPTLPETEEPLSSGTSSPIESDNGNDSSCTLEASFTETEDTKEEEDDFQSLKSSSTYFSPDSSYSLQSVSEESKAGDNVATELENITEDVPSIAAAIEDLRSLSVTAEAPLPTPTVKQTESPKKRTSFSSFFQVKRKTT